MQMSPTVTGVVQKDTYLFLSNNNNNHDDPIQPNGQDPVHPSDSMKEIPTEFRSDDRDSPTESHEPDGHPIGDGCEVSDAGEGGARPASEGPTRSKVGDAGGRQVQRAVDQVAEGQVQDEDGGGIVGAAEAETGKKWSIWVELLEK